MTGSEYQALAIRTAGTHQTFDQAVANWCLGLAGETGEVVDYLKKVLFHGHALSPEVVKKELGDVLWYVAVLADELGLDLDEVMAANIAKLRARYPDGFDQQRSIHRTTDEDPISESWAALANGPAGAKSAW